MGPLKERVGENVPKEHHFTEGALLEEVEAMRAKTAAVAAVAAVAAACGVAVVVSVHRNTARSTTALQVSVKRICRLLRLLEIAITATAIYAMLLTQMCPYGAM